MSINLSNTECLVKLDSVIATKVANICTGSVDWVYYPWPTMLMSVIGYTLLAVCVSFFLILFTISVFITK